VTVDAPALESSQAPLAGMGRKFAPHRVRAVVLQHLLNVWHSPIRLIELFYWPIIQLVLWGFITSYLLSSAVDLPGGVLALLGAVMLWDHTFRMQNELNLVSMFDMWDRNQVNLRASPLTQVEYLCAALILALARSFSGSVVLVVLARWWFDYDLFTIGATLLPALIVLTLFATALGFFIGGFITRFGSNAQILAWSLAALLQPFAAVFYPVSALPGWLQVVARALPVSHVFEALRAVVAETPAPAAGLGIALAEAIILLALAFAFNLWAYRRVRELGLLSSPGY